MCRKICILISPSQTKKVGNTYVTIGEARNSLNRNRGNAFIQIEMSIEIAEILFGHTLQSVASVSEKFDYSRPSAHYFGCSFRKKKIKNLKDIFVITDTKKTVDEIPNSVMRILGTDSKYTLYMLGRLATDVGPVIAECTNASNIDDDEVAEAFGCPTLADILAGILRT
jgi:hypothetical protein